MKIKTLFLISLAIVPLHVLCSHEQEITTPQFGDFILGKKISKKRGDRTTDAKVKKPGSSQVGAITVAAKKTEEKRSCCR